MDLAYRRKERKIAVRLQFDDDESFIDNKEVEEDTLGSSTWQKYNLSNSNLPPPAASFNSEDGEYTPAKKKRCGNQQKKHDGKRPWTAEEISAILQGVQSYEKGSWAIIKKK